MAQDKIRRGPTIKEIAALADVGTATVGRILNGREGVRGQTRQRVLEALEFLSGAVQKPVEPLPAKHKIAFLSDSGQSYNDMLAKAVQEVVQARTDIQFSFDAVTTADVDPLRFSMLIERAAKKAEALILVAREDLSISRAIGNVMAKNVPVICLNTDLPTSERATYIGSDQTGAGATAAYLMGQVVGNHQSKILLVYSAPYRNQEERELGFRRILRSEFPRLVIDERLNSNDDRTFVYRNMVKYLEEHGPPAGIYNVGAGNMGIAEALREFNLIGKTIFIGHELTPNTRLLLETGIMTFAVGHDVRTEINMGLNYAVAMLENRMPPKPGLTPVRTYTKYSCNFVEPALALNLEPATAA